MNKGLACPEWEEQLALKREDLPPADRRALEEHLLTCSSCQATQQSYARLIAHLRDLHDPVIQPLPRLRDLMEEESKQEIPPSVPQRATLRKKNLFETFFAAFTMFSLLLILILLLHGALPGGTHAGAQTPFAATQLCIGTDFPLSGADASQGIPAQKGANLAISLNHTLGQGYTLTSCNKDDASSTTGIHDPVQGVANVLGFIKDPTVMGVVGPGNSNVAEAEIPLVTSAGLAMVSSETTDLCLTLQQYCVHPDQVHPPGRPDAFFRLPPNDTEQGKADADLMYKNLGMHTACVVDDQEAYGQSLAYSFSTYFRADGGSALGARQHIAAGDTPAQLAQVAQACVALRSNAVFYGGTTSNGAGLLKHQLALAGFTGPFVGGDGIVSDSQYLLDAGVDADNTYATSLGPDPSTFASSPFAIDYMASFGSQPDQRSAGAYDAAMILITAIQSALKTEPADLASLRSAVLDKVMHPDQPYNGITGKITFDSNGDNVARKILTVYGIANGSWVYKPDYDVVVSFG